VTTDTSPILATETEYCHEVLYRRQCECFCSRFSARTVWHCVEKLETKAHVFLLEQTN